MADVIGRGVIEVSADSSKLNAAINEARRSIESLGDASARAAKRNQSSIRDYIRDLQTQAAVQGKTTREAELYKLALKGATDEQLRTANSALKLTEAYERGLTIGDQLKATAGNIAKGFLTVAAAAGTASIAVLAVGEKLIGQVADYKKLSEIAGDSAENFGTLQEAADTSGTSLDRVAQFSVKLTDVLAKTNDESKIAGRALASIGISFKEFKTAEPVAQLDILARALAKFKDDPRGQTAVLDALVKGSAQLKPFLNDLADGGERTVKITQAQIEAADAFTKAQARQVSQLKTLGQQIASEVLPSIVSLTGGFRDAVGQLSGLDRGASDLAKNRSISDFANEAILVLAKIADSAVATARAIGIIGASFGQAFEDVKLLASAAQLASKLTPAGLALGGGVPGLVQGTKEFKAQLDERNKALDAYNKKLDAFLTGKTTTFEDAVRGRIGQQGAGAGRGSADDPRRTDAAARARKIDTSGLSRDKSGAGRADREAEQVRRAELDADLKFLRDKQQDERDAISFHQRELSALYSAGSISLAQFYDERERTIAEGVQREKNLLIDEQARLEVQIETEKDPSNRVKLNTQLSESIQKSNRLDVESQRAATLAVYERIAAQKQLNEQVQGFRASIAQQAGDETGAARIRAQQQVDQAQDLARRAGGAISPADLAAFRASLDQTIAVNAAKKSQSEINQRLSIEEERIALQQRTGSISELAALAKTGEARRAVVGDMERQVEELERIARDRPLDIQLTIDASRARLELDKFKAELDPLGDKFREIFSGAGTSAINDFLNGTKSAKDALRGFGKSILTEINAITSKQIAASLFSKEGVLGSIGGIFSGQKTDIGDFVTGIAGGTLNQIEGRRAGGPTNERQSILDLFKPKADTVAASFQTLTAVGIQPATDALTKLAQAANDAAVRPVGQASANSVDAPVLTTGDFTRTDHGAPVTADTERQQIVDLFREPNASAKEFSSVIPAASAALNRLGGVGQLASQALSILPSIISAISASAAGSSASSGSGFFSSLFSGFGGGGGASSAVNLATGFGHSGGVVGRLTDYRQVPVAAFAYAPRYHTGGIAGAAADAAAPVAAAAAAPPIAPVPADHVRVVLRVGEELIEPSDPRHRERLAPTIAQERAKGREKAILASPRAIAAALTAPVAPAAPSLRGIVVPSPQIRVPGLASDEAPAFLKRGTEILTASDPRHTDNLAATIRGGHADVLKVIGGDAFARAVGGPGGKGGPGGPGGDATISLAAAAPAVSREVHTTETHTEHDSLHEIRVLGARAIGGPVSAGGAYEVNEKNRPEVLNVGGRQYLMPLPQSGSVSDAPASGDTINYSPTFVLPQGPVDQRTQQQLAAEAYRGAQTAWARNKGGR